MISLDKPVVGPTLDIGLFDEILRETGPMQESKAINHFDTDHRLTSALAQTAGIVINEHQASGIAASRVEPGSYQINRRWHTDVPNLVSAANVLTTEFLVGDAVSIKSLIAQRKHHFPRGNLEDDTQVNFRIIAEHAKQVSDEELREMGFTIWRPRPREVVSFNYRNIHRSRTNNGPSPLVRVYGYIQDYEDFDLTYSARAEG